MDALAEEFGPSNVESIFVYTHEAHPGENLPHLTSMEQKADHARQFVDYVNLRREVLLDSLDGACHRAFGSMPNMTWIFDRSGQVLYKAPWTEVRSVRSALHHLVETSQLRRDGLRLAPLAVERIDYRLADREAFYQGLERNGPRAVEEFRQSGF